MKKENNKLDIEKLLKKMNTLDLQRVVIDILKREELLGKVKEHMWLIGFGKEHDFLCMDTVAFGSLSHKKIKPLSVFSNGLFRKAAYAIIIHNFLKDDFEVSKRDKDIADRLYQSGNMLGLKVEDYIVVNCRKIVSFKYLGILEEIKKSLKYITTYDIFEKGEISNKVNTVKRMMKLKIDIDIIMKVTLFTKKEIEEILKKEDIK